MIRLTKASLLRLRRRANQAMKDPDKFARFSISAEAVLALLDALENS